MMKPDGPILLEIYKRAILIKQNDERLRRTIRSGKLVATYYSPRGQEIIPSALSVSLNEHDYVVTTYRGVHDQLAKGMPLDLLWAEYAGRATGACKGKGGPMHITCPEKGIMVTTGIVGSGLPIANGLGLASQLMKDGRVTVVNFGDGASNIGAFHESLNMAAIWKLPVVFVCQNNRYAEHTAYAFGTSVVRVSDRAMGYGIDGHTVNGNDPDEMWAIARQAISKARSGGGPTLIEALTFRFEGHNMGDDGHYIPSTEMEAARLLDPVPLLRTRLLNEGFASEAELTEFETSVESRIDDAINFAFASEWAGLAELRRDVFSEELSA